MSNDGIVVAGRAGTWLWPEYELFENVELWAEALVSSLDRYDEYVQPRILPDRPPWHEVGDPNEPAYAGDWGGQLRFRLDEHGCVLMDGALAKPTFAPLFNLICTLPIQYRPSQAAVVVPTLEFGGGSSGNSGALLIINTGTVLWGGQTADPILNAFSTGYYEARRVV